MSVAAAAVAVAGVQAVNQYSSSRREAAAMRAQAEYNRKISEINESYTMAKSDDAIRRGEQEVESHRSKVRQLVGSQKAALAASGVDISSGSAAQIVDQSERLGELDAITLKNNAWREAYGYKVEAKNIRIQGMMGQATAATQARNTLVSGGLNAVTTLGKGVYDFYK
jgi:hypothetical protein